MTLLFVNEWSSGNRNAKTDQIEAVLLLFIIWLFEN
jgi:hypothetical protein